MITDSLPMPSGHCDDAIEPSIDLGHDRRGSARPGEHPTVFFDGECGLCDRWVDFVLRWDHSRKFRFSPLQGESARDWLLVTPEQPLNSVVLVDERGVHRKSDAVWRMFRHLGGRWRVAAWFLRMIPGPLRNWGYEFVARHRYQWFGKKESCRLPTPDERSRFLP